MPLTDDGILNIIQCRMFAPAGRAAYGHILLGEPFPSCTGNNSNHRDPTESLRFSRGITAQHLLDIGEYLNTDARGTNGKLTAIGNHGCQGRLERIWHPARRESIERTLN
jgi:hypothetical protein